MRVKASATGEEGQIIHRQKRSALRPIIFREDVLLPLDHVWDVHVSVFFDDDVICHACIRILDDDDVHTRLRFQLLLFDVLLPLARQRAVVIEGH